MILFWLGSADKLNKTIIIIIGSRKLVSSFARENCLTRWCLSMSPILESFLFCFSLFDLIVSCTGVCQVSSCHRLHVTGPSGCGS